MRPIFAEWYGRYKINMASGKLATARTLHIVTTRHTEFVGEAIAAALRHTRLKVTRSTRMPRRFNHHLYVVVAAQTFRRMPPDGRTIAVQMEQVRASQWMNAAYLERLHASLAVLDYSRDNIAALIERGIPFRQIYHVPIRPIRREAVKEAERDIDVLFYGGIRSERRGRYIDALSGRVDLRIETDTFGPALRDILDRTRIVVNIHFYENALLETTRLSEALSHGARVVSEDAEDQAEHRDFEGLVDFCPRGDVGAFVQQVEATLAAWSGPVAPPGDEGLEGMPFHLLRALSGIGVLSFEELRKACRLPPDRLLAALLESAAS